MLQPNFHPFPELRTQRLLLRRLTKEDVEEIFKLRSDEDVMKFIGKITAATPREAMEFINGVNESWMANTGILWAIELQENPGKLIGYIGHWRLIKEHYRSEVGYMLMPEYWNQGIMKEALLTVIDFGFQSIKLHSIEAHIDPNNVASSGLLQATGFVREGYFKEDFYFKGKFNDTAIYSKLKN